MKIITSSALIIAIALLSAPISAETETTTDIQDEEVANEETVAEEVSEEAPAAPPTTEEIAGGMCAGCHSADGNSIIPINPNLAGQHAGYLTKQLMDFQSVDGETAKRNSAVMTAMVAALTKENMQELGEYYARQEVNHTATSEADADVIAAGKILYHGGNLDSNVPACASCHGPTGSGLPPHYPGLAGQHAAYTLAQLELFNKGERANDNGVMQKVLSRMNALEKKAVSEYISTMR